MPWINDDYYIETDLSDLETHSLMFTVEFITRELRKADPEAVSFALPMVEEAETGLAALKEIYYSSAPQTEEIKWDRKVKAAKKALCEVVEELGEKVAILIHLDKISKHSHHFPHIYRYSLRKPANVATFLAHYISSNKRWELKCSKRPAVLLNFTWEASEDGGVTWIRLGKSRTPTFTITTQKLSPDKQYLFRMIMSNPAGKSDYHFYNRHLATEPLPHTPVRSSRSYSRGRRKKRRRR